MFNRFLGGTFVATLVVLAAAAPGCGGSRTPSAPSAVTPPAQSIPQPTAPVIAAVSPNAGSTGGGAWGTITGSGFQPGAQVTFGGSAPANAAVKDSTTMLFWTAPHVAGAVDVMVTNPAGLADTAARGYTFESPEAFDFNGTWTGHTGPEFETEMIFVVANNRLISVSCGGSAPMALSSSPAVANGEFLVVVSGDIEMSARIVSARNAVGTIKLGPCVAGRWWGERIESARGGQ